MVNKLFNKRFIPQPFPTIGRGKAESNVFFEDRDDLAKAFRDGTRCPKKSVFRGTYHHHDGGTQKVVTTKRKWHFPFFQSMSITNYASID